MDSDGSELQQHHALAFVVHECYDRRWNWCKPVQLKKLSVSWYKNMKNNIMFEKKTLYKNISHKVQI